MDKPRRFAPPAVGGSALLVIFGVLCLTVFALLALSTVQADGRLSGQSARAVQAYYAADCSAEIIYARLRAGELPEGVIRSGDRYSYACPVSDTQRLCVQVCREESGWRVLAWQVQSVTDWTAGEGPELWNGT